MSGAADLASRRALLGSLAAGLATPALAQGGDWPSRPVRLVVPYPPGGTTDTVARQFAEFMRGRMSQPVVVENRAGASTNIGTEAVVRSAPDGHTLLFGATSLASNPVFGPALPGIDPMTALDPIGMLVRIPYMVAVHPSFAPRTPAEMILAARANPGRLTIASAQLDFQIALLSHHSRIQLEHVGYRGGAAAVSDAIAGHVQMVYTLVPVLLSPVRNGQLRALAVTGRQRSSLLPDVPTFAESGESNAVSESWFALFSPAGTPPPIIARLAEDAAAFTRDPATRSRMLEIGVETASASPQEMATILRDLTAEYREVVRAMPGRQTQ